MSIREHRLKNSINFVHYTKLLTNDFYLFLNQ